MFGRLKNKFRDDKSANVRRANKMLAETDYLDAAGEVKGLLRAYPDRFEIFSNDGVREAIEWSDLLNGRWSGQDLRLCLVFVDPQLPEVVLQLSENYNELFVTAVRERIEYSLVYQLSDILPSGVVVRGQVRRNADGSLFTQVLTDSTPEVADYEAMISFEGELRQAVGL
ncbi:hypothetical protein RQN30_02385 [Arcanobacterium hippocoleae]